MLSNPNPTDRNDELGGSGSYVEGMSRVQRGEVGDITAGLPLGPWTEALAQKLMAQSELTWDESGIHGAEREKQRQEFANRLEQRGWTYNTKSHLWSKSESATNDREELTLFT